MKKILFDDLRIDIDEINEINYDEAKEDVKPFIKNVDDLNLWCKEFFVNITDKLQ